MTDFHNRIKKIGAGHIFGAGGNENLLIYLLLPNCMISNFYRISFQELQGDQVPGIFQAGPKRQHPTSKPGIIFHNLEFFKNKTKFLDFTGIFTIFYQYLCRFPQHLGFMMSKIKTYD